MYNVFFLKEHPDPLPVSSFLMKRKDSAVEHASTKKGVQYDQGSTIGMGLEEVREDVSEIALNDDVSDPSASDNRSVADTPKYAKLELADHENVDLSKAEDKDEKKRKAENEPTGFKTKFESSSETTDNVSVPSRVFGSGFASVGFGYVAANTNPFLSAGSGTSFLNARPAHEAEAEGEPKTTGNNNNEKDDSASNADEDSSEEVQDFGFSDSAPKIPLVEQLISGEEEEDHLFQVKGKLFFMDATDASKQWKERGVGMVRVNRSHATDASRIIMRTDVTLKLILNTLIDDKMNFELVQEKNIRFVGLEDGKPGVYLLRLRGQNEAEEFLETIESLLSDPKTKES